MSTITATADAAKAQVRLDVDFSDTGGIYALVNRVDAVTGATTAVRGHGASITADGVAYAPMQAGFKAVLYDTEMPLDRAFYYTAFSPTATLNVASEFSGGYTEPWYVTDPAITMRITSDGSGADFLSFYTAGATASPTIRGEDIPAAVGATYAITATVSMSATNGVTIGLSFRDNTGAIIGTGSASATVLGTTTFSASGVAPAGTVTVQPFLQMQGTPGAAVTASFSSVIVFQAQRSVTSSAVVVPSVGACWFKDPLRPGNNVRVDFVWDPNPLCIPSEGIFWQSLDTDQRAANAAVFNINNQPDPVVVTKERSSPTSTLTLVSRTFADRDRLVTLLGPGSPLLFQAPDEYGVPDRNMSVGTTSEAKVLPDTRIPIRVFSMPHSVCAAPGGPMAGTVGARWSDTCNRYATWGAVNTAGLTWIQVLDGLAG